MDNFTINNNAQFDNISISANGNKEVKNNVIPKETSFPQQHPQNKIYGDVPTIPVLDAVEGIKFDFNDGIRILFPNNGKEYHVTFTDIDTGIILYSADTVPGAYVTSVKKFYIRFRLIIRRKRW